MEQANKERLKVLTAAFEHSVAYPIAQPVTYDQAVSCKAFIQKNLKSKQWELDHTDDELGELVLADEINELKQTLIEVEGLIMHLA